MQLVRKVAMFNTCTETKGCVQSLLISTCIRAIIMPHTHIYASSLIPSALRKCKGEADANAGLPCMLSQLYIVYFTISCIHPGNRACARR